MLSRIPRVKSPPYIRRPCFHGLRRDLQNPRDLKCTVNVRVEVQCVGGELVGRVGGCAVWLCGCEELCGVCLYV